MNECPFCGGPLTLLGRLAGLVHFRCRDCGMDSHVEASSLEELDEEEEYR